jgi:hypothetical protein
VTSDKVKALLQPCYTINTWKGGVRKEVNSLTLGDNQQDFRQAPELAIAN